MPSSYTLGSRYERFVKDMVDSGRYATASEVSAVLWCQPTISRHRRAPQAAPPGRRAARLYRAKRSEWRCRRGTPMRRTTGITAFIMAGGPQM